MICTSSYKSTPQLPNQFDIILVSGEYWADHPHSGVGVIARVLDAHGFSVAIIEKPDWTNLTTFLQFGVPRLFYGITSGPIDSMLQNYTPLKKPRAKDPYNPYSSNIPDRAVIVYSQKIREAWNLYRKEHRFSTTAENTLISPPPLILGGVEASLRRFSHFDNWDNTIRKPILFDSKADLLVYGPGEHQIIDIANRCQQHQNLEGIPGTSIILNEDQLNAQEAAGFSFERLPEYETVLNDPRAFCSMHLQFSNQKNLIQRVDDRYMVQYAMYPYTSADLDALYNLPFSYYIPPYYKELEMARFSIMTHRGCIGQCNFCSIALHQGNKIISRSEANIIAEIRRMQRDSEFKGYISDIGGPSANMFGMDCMHSTQCSKSCWTCSNLDRTHRSITHLLRSSRELPGITKTFVRSGIRYDLTVAADDYLQELCTYHISGSLKIAPEHFSPHICALMGKSNESFPTFKKKFEKINTPLHQELKYYFMVAHPGSTLQDSQDLRQQIHVFGLKNTESVQIFTPTPMSISSCMYYTGLNPFTLEPIHIPYSYREKKLQKNVLFQ